MNTRIRRFEFLLFACVFLLDQGIKIVIRQFASGTVLFSLGILEIVSLQNSGAAFGVLAAHPFLLSICGLLFLLLLHQLLGKDSTCRQQLLFCLLSGGAAGNLADRLLHGSVTDYIYLPSLHFPVFNFADICITAACTLLAWDFLFGGHSNPASRHSA